MADQKVSDLPSLSGADVDAADLLYIVDSSAGSAGSKKITVGQYQLAPVSGGTANGVAYLNGSKVVTTGSGLVFDGTNLGVGTSSPGAKLEVVGAVKATVTPSNSVQSSFLLSNSASTSAANLQLNTSGGLAFWSFQSGGAGWFNSATLDTSGNLGLGVTPSVYTANSRVFQVDGGANAAEIKLTNNTSGASGATGAIFQMTGNDLYIWNSENSFLSLGTNNTERARITSGGDLLVGGHTAVTTIGGRGSKINAQQAAATAEWAGGFIHPATTGTNAFGVGIRYSASSPNSANNPFLFMEDNAAARAEIRSNGGIANYQANDANLSDRREKTNFAPAKSYLDTICAIPVQTFNYIDQSPDDPGLTLGVVAQDVQAVAPELVMESNWGTEDNPKIRLSIYQTDLQYALMKCIQELKAQNDELRARVAALEQA